MRKRLPRLVFLAALAVVASLRSLGGDERPPAPLLDAALVARMPEAYRDRALAVRLSEEGQKYLAKASDDSLFEYVVDAIGEEPDGLAFLATALESDPSGARRASILGRLGSPRETPTTAEARAALEKHAASDADAKASLAALEGLRRLEIARLGVVLRDRMRVARDSGDRAGLELLSEENHSYQWYGDVFVPGKLRDAPPPFSVVAGKRPIRAVAFGDFGSGEEGQKKTAAGLRAYAKAHPLDLGITLGDNFYPRGMDGPDDPRWKTQWESLYGPLGIRFYASFGNHDYGFAQSPLSELWYGRTSAGGSRSWSLPARYYTFTAGDAQFFQIDTVDLTERELTWLERQLAESRATWKIVYGHYQIFSATRGDNDEKQDDLVHRLLPILVKGGADLYVCGHDHNLQFLEPEGSVHFVVAGAGGAGLYEFEQENYTRSTFKAKTFGFAILEADPKSLTVRLVDFAGKELKKETWRKAERPAG